MIVQTLRSLGCKLLYGLFIVAALSACSGGISGTGDGGIIIDPDDNLSTDGMPEGTADSDGAMTESQLFPFTLSSSGLTNSLSEAATRVDATTAADAGDTALSATIALENRTRAYSNVAATVMRDLSLMEATLINELNACSNSVCDSLPTSITASIDATTTVTFSSVQFSRGLSGYFDNRLTYMREAGDLITLLWADTAELVSFYSNTSTSITYAIEETFQPSLTFRQLNKSDNSVTQATITRTAEGDTLMEAELPDWYVKAMLNTQSSVLYAISADEQTLLREATVAVENQLLIETCRTTDCVWQPAHSVSTDIFNDTESTLGNFDATITATPAVTFIEEPDRFVVAASGNNGNPAEGSLLCGGSSVLGRYRVFCWVPVPLEAIDPLYFEETIEAGSVSYRQLEISD